MAKSEVIANEVKSSFPIGYFTSTSVKAEASAECSPQHPGSSKTNPQSALAGADQPSASLYRRHLKHVSNIQISSIRIFFKSKNCIFFIFFLSENNGLWSGIHRFIRAKMEHWVKIYFPFPGSTAVERRKKSH